MSSTILDIPQRGLDVVPTGRQASIPEIPLRVGTRGSPLALAQTRAVMSLLGQRLRGNPLSTNIIRTTGDAIQGRRLADIGGKGLFSKEIHEALLEGHIDLAVHSLKDLETALPPGVVIACALPRQDARDALILAPGTPVPTAQHPFATLPLGALVGSSSVRRQAQLLAARPDIRIETIRGNVETRLSKLDNHAFAATFLAVSGLQRLNLQSAASVILDPGVMVPAAGQGIVGVTVRDADTDLRDLLHQISDSRAGLAASAERAALHALDGSCRTPIGAYARLLPDGVLHLVGLVARVDGSFVLRRDISGASGDATRLGSELGASLRLDSPHDIFE